jgi:hypothetical protein
MTATAKVIQRLEVSSGITCGLIPDCAALMVITRFAPYRPELHYMRGPGLSGMPRMIRAPHRSTVFSAALRTLTDVAARPSTNS